MDNPENSSLPRESITSKVVRGGAWMYSRMLLTNLINLGVMAFLARRLTPAEFGLVALAQVSLQLLVVLGSEGINEFVIYDNQEGRERRAQAAFWMDLVFAAGAAAVGLLLAPLAARFYGEPQLAPILIAMLLRYPIDTLSKVPDALLKKRLDFHKLVIRDTVLEIAMSLASVALALTGWGVWSLVLPGMMASPVRAVVVMRMARWRPGLNFHFSHWPRIFKYTANIIGGTLTSFILNEGDTVLIGRLMGSHTLGVYNLAWQSANLVPRNLNGIVNRMALPAFSAVAGDPERLLAGFNRITRLVSILAFPPLIGLFVVADDFILTLYGPQWQGAVFPLRILIIYALRYSVGSPAGPLYKAAGRTDYTFRLGLINVPFYLISIWLGSYWGIVGVAAGITLSRTLFGLIGYVLAARCMHTRFMKIVEPLVPAFLASLWMAGVVLAAKLLLDALIPQSALVRLLTLVALGGLTYLILLRTAYKDLAEDLARVTAPLSGPWHVWVRRALNTS